MHKRRYSSGTEWEGLVGYSRAIRTGNMIYVSGTTATDMEGNLIGIGDPAKQTEQIIKNIETALHKLGASLDDVVRTRIYVRDINDWGEIGGVHGTTFGDILPATSMVQVSALIDPRMLVEIEAEAIIEI